MAGPILLDRVKESTTDTGVLTTFTLGGAVLGFNAFLQAGLLDVGDWFHIGIEHTNRGLAEWQVCRAELATETTITVLEVYDSSRIDKGAVTFSAGAKYVWIDFDATLAQQSLAGITQEQVETLLEDYVTSDDLTTSLADYVTSAALTATLGSYATDAEVTTLLAGYSTPSSVATQIAGATIATSQLSGNLDYSRIDGTGPFADQFIPNLNASKINAGDLAIARIAVALTAPGPIGSVTPSTIAGTTGTLSVTDAVLNATTPSLDIVHLSSGTPTTGFAAAIRLRGHTSTNTLREMGSVESRWTIATDATATAATMLYAYRATVKLAGVTVAPAGVGVTNVGIGNNAAAQTPLVPLSMGTPSAGRVWALYQNNASTFYGIALGSDAIQIRTAATSSVIQLGADNNDSFVEWMRLASGLVTFADGVNVVTNTTTGSKIGTSVSQKIGFWNATPVVQPAAAAQASVATTAATQTTPWGFSTQAQADGIITLLNEIRRSLVLAGLMKGSA